MTGEKEYGDGSLRRAFMDRNNAQAEKPFREVGMDTEGRIKLSRVALENTTEDLESTDSDEFVDVNKLFSTFLNDESQPLPELRKVVLGSDNEEDVDGDIMEQVRKAFYVYLKELGYTVLNEEE